MTFLSPSFVFAFLPVALSIYALMPKYLRVYSLPALGLIFYVTVNLKSPFALIAMPVIILAVTAAVELFKRKKNRVFLEVCRVASIIAVFSVLVFRVMGFINVLSGIGVIITLMAAISLCSDVLWGQGRVPDSPWDILIYLTFFPLFMVGPFVKYGDFVEKVDRLEFSLDNFSLGAIRFVSGFIKCVAISAVLGEAYDRLFEINDPGLLLIVLLIIVRGVGFFSFISGYSDIAVGISSMLGIRIGRDHGNFFCNVTPCEFIRNFCSGLLDFCRSYITVPVSLIVSGSSGTAVASVFAAFFYVLVFAKNMETVYTLMIPMTAAMMFIVLRTGKRRRGVSLVPKILGCTATFFLASAVMWYVLYSGGPEGIMQLPEGDLLAPIPPRAIAIIADIKYVIVPLISGLCVWSVGALFKNDNAYLDAKQNGMPTPIVRDGAIKLAAKYIATAILLVVFVFSVMMILPQYPYLASVNYFFPFM